jgi:hypothetical protein
MTPTQHTEAALVGRPIYILTRRHKEMMPARSTVWFVVLQGIMAAPSDAFVHTLRRRRPHGAFLAPSQRTTALLSLSLDKKPYEFALLFDCDGVILETEELHRIAYNRAFKEFDLSIDGNLVEWSVRVCLSMYRILPILRLISHTQLLPTDLLFMLALLCATTANPPLF